MKIYLERVGYRDNAKDRRKPEPKTAIKDCLGVEISPMLNTDKNNVYLGYVMRFNIEPKRAIDNLMKFLREKPLNEKLL